MKKYHQLILLIVSVISLTLFLIYRHEYNRLHYVLEVFNFFGQPCNFSDLQTAEFTLKQHDWGPQPIWQETDNSYIYSAFLTEKTEVKALALPIDFKKLPRTCYFWLENNKKPILGKFSFSKIMNGGDGNLIPYFYYCSTTNLENFPYAVSFSYVGNHEIDMKKILLVNSYSANTLNINTTICVSPSTFSKKRFVEFFSFHRLIGVDSFIFYNKDIPYRLSKLINNLSKRLDVKVAFLPWNFPKVDTSVAHTIIQYDCLFRTQGQSRYSTVLELNEYIVPITSFSINELVEEFDQHVNKLGLPVQRFCINNIRENKPLALQNYEVAIDANYKLVHFIYKQFKDNALRTNALDKSRVSVHKYVRCRNNIKTTTDFSMKKFSTDFTRSTLVQLLINNQL